MLEAKQGAHGDSAKVGHGRRGTPAWEQAMIRARNQADRYIRAAHQKRQQERHPDLTMTGMYNVLEKLRSGDPLSAKEKTIHEQGLVSVLKQIHDDLDAAVAEAYGWPADLDEQNILQRLVDLNHQRAAEEAEGRIRYLRPDYQNPEGPKEKQGELLTAKDAKSAKPRPHLPSPNSNLPAGSARLPWPKTLPEQIRAIRSVLGGIPSDTDVNPNLVSKYFKGARKAKVEEILNVLNELSG